MTSVPISNQFISMSNDDILYNHYSYYGLEYVVDMLKGFYDRYSVIGKDKDPMYDKKCSMLKFEIITHFCHYAEELGAFLYLCHEVNPSFNSADILENLTKYRVSQIGKFYQDFSAEYTSNDIERNNFNRLFGYDRIKSGQGAEETISLSLTNIFNVIKAIAEFYNFWQESYNAYKHGYRLWFGHEYKQDLNVVLYLRKYNKLMPRNNMDHLPVDDESVNDVYNFTKYCRHIFDIIFDNHRSLLNAGNNLSSVQFVFLEYKEPKTRTIKKEFNI